MTTDRQQIQQWLDRFMAGATTEQEERQLADYFCTEADIPEEWAAFAVMFKGLRQGSGGHVAARRGGWRWMAAAAVVVAVLGLGWLYGGLERQGRTAETAATPPHSEPAARRTTEARAATAEAQTETAEAGELTAKAEKPMAAKSAKAKRQRQRGRQAAMLEEAAIAVAATPAAEESTAPLLNIDMTAVQQQGEDLRTALAIVNSEIFETE